MTLSMNFDNVWRTLAVWKRAAVTGRPAVVRVLGRTALTPTHSVHVVEADGERLVVGCHPGGFLILTRNHQQLGGDSAP